MLLNNILISASDIYDYSGRPFNAQNVSHKLTFLTQLWIWRYFEVDVSINKSIRIYMAPFLVFYSEALPTLMYRTKEYYLGAL